jgi:betaine-aldehyde dehydrogenase
MSQRIQNVIDGKSADAASGRTGEVIDPSTGAAFASAPVSGPEDVDAAFAAAARVLEGRSAGECAPGLTSVIRREPIGVCAQITRGTTR